MKPAFRMRLCSLVLCLVLAVLSGCSEQPLPQGDDAFRQMHSAQFALPEKGEQIAVVTTSLGVIKIRLFGEGGSGGGGELHWPRQIGIL